MANGVEVWISQGATGFIGHDHLYDFRTNPPNGEYIRIPKDIEHIGIPLLTTIDYVKDLHR